MTGFLTNLVSDADMCNCGQQVLTEEEQYGVYANTPCTAITVDLLQMYKNPIDCYINYKLWGVIDMNESQLSTLSGQLQVLINQKISDPNNCDGIEHLAHIRSTVDKIVKRGVCL